MSQLQAVIAVVAIQTDLLMQVGYIVQVGSITQVYLAVIAVKGGKYIDL